MNNSVGILELRSISKGFETADEMVKTAAVEVLTMRPICPGKFLIMIHGDEAAVEEAMNVGTTMAKGQAVDSFVLHGTHPAVIQALKHRYERGEIDAVGIWETSSVTSGLASFNKAIKESNIRLVRMICGNGIGGKFVAVMTGSVSDVREAIDICVRNTDEKRIVNVAVIPAPSEVVKKQFD
ncbi:BMC domain-containing protein [Brevibacillus ginsengisoli]|uniref:BMC domain-containing protein n=1 Tax=Brevibacillus ginsengisoli TaxID=363854 RepID=UPI003CEE9E14